jgi:hypothetical protein
MAFPVDRSAIAGAAKIPTLLCRQHRTDGSFAGAARPFPATLADSGKPFVLTELGLGGLFATFPSVFPTVQKPEAPALALDQLLVIMNHLLKL